MQVSAQLASCVRSVNCLHRTRSNSSVALWQLWPQAASSCGTSAYTHGGWILRHAAPAHLATLASLQVWSVDTGMTYTSVEPGRGDINDVCVWPGSGLLFTGSDSPHVGVYFCPSLGPAPSWCVSQGCAAFAPCFVYIRICPKPHLCCTRASRPVACHVHINLCLPMLSHICQDKVLTDPRTCGGRTVQVQLPGLRRRGRRRRRRARRSLRRFPLPHAARARPPRARTPYRNPPPATVSAWFLRGQPAVP